MFIFNYFYYYHKGKTDRSYMALYQELDEFARTTVAMFILFLVFTYVAQDFEGFGAVLFKGGILSAVVIPALYVYYSDTTRFLF